jgi:hypothetical protein
MEAAKNHFGIARARGLGDSCVFLNLERHVNQMAKADPENSDSWKATRRGSRKIMHEGRNGSAAFDFDLIEPERPLVDRKVWSF